jgi:hypothetical protein
MSVTFTEFLPLDSLPGSSSFNVPSPSGGIEGGAAVHCGTAMYLVTPAVGPAAVGYTPSNLRKAVPSGFRPYGGAAAASSWTPGSAPPMPMPRTEQRRRIRSTSRRSPHECPCRSNRAAACCPPRRQAPGGRPIPAQGFPGPRFARLGFPRRGSRRRARCGCQSGPGRFPEAL